MMKPLISEAQLAGIRQRIIEVMTGAEGYYYKWSVRR